MKGGKIYPATLSPQTYPYPLENKELRVVRANGTNGALVLLEAARHRTTLRGQAGDTNELRRAIHPLTHKHETKRRQEPRGFGGQNGSMARRFDRHKPKRHDATRCYALARHSHLGANSRGGAMR